jgi:serine/threonine protein kinase
VNRKAKISDAILPDLSDLQLEKLGLEMGEVVTFKKEAAAFAASPLMVTGAVGGAAAVAANAAVSPSPLPLLPLPSASTSLSLFTQAYPKASANTPPPAITVHPLHLPSVPLASLPPLTQACGSPGASGSVFKIEYQGKDAAVKEFHKHMHSMLRRELKSLQLLAHPNIVRMLAVVTDSAAQPVGFIMEYLHMPLDEAMQYMTLRQAVFALAETCIGVAVAHDAQVIHSDIKPGNILCSVDFSIVKLADFGLAHAITASLSAVSGVRGTALYMAPELHEDAPLSVSTDMFSFGMMAWQVLHPGVENPLGSNIVTISAKLGRGIRPAFTRADAPPALKELVARCLAHDASQRPSSMWEVHRELSAILQQLSVSHVAPADHSQPCTLAALLCQPALSAPPHSPLSSCIQLLDEPAASDFCNFVRARVRREDGGTRISRISRVLLGGARMATYIDLFMREMNSRSSNPMMRPANLFEPACVSGLNKLKSLFERTCLPADSACNIVMAWHGTPAQHVEAVLRDGPRAFRTTDGGYFGAGSYFAIELDYAMRYAMMQVFAQIMLAAAAARRCAMVSSVCRRHLPAASIPSSCSPSASRLPTWSHPAEITPQMTQASRSDGASPSSTATTPADPWRSCRGT